MTKFFIILTLGIIILLASGKVQAEGCWANVPEGCHCEFTPYGNRLVCNGLSAPSGGRGNQVTQQSYSSGGSFPSQDQVDEAIAEVCAGGIAIFFVIAALVLVFRTLTGNYK